MPLIFCGILLWLYRSNPYLPAAQIEITGHVSNPSSQMVVRWNSGHGLNGYEMNRYALQPLTDLQEKDGIKVEISRTGEKNPASLQAKVILSDIEVDGQRYLLPEGQSGQIEKQANGLIVLKDKGSGLNLLLHLKHHLHLEFLTFNRAGVVKVDMAGKTDRRDLYTSNDMNGWSRENSAVLDYWFVAADGRFAITMDMPRYPVEAYRVESNGAFTVSSFRITAAGEKTLSLDGGLKTPEGIVYRMSGVNKKIRRYFHPLRFGLQVLCSLIATWIISALFSYAGRFTSARDMFFNEKRYLFWLMFLGSCGLYFLWLFAFWPGVASTDSLKIWRAAQIPGMFLGDHPPLNVIFYQFLSFFWNNMAVVPIFQILCTSLLTASIFFSFYRWRLSLWVLVPSYLLVAFSLPVGMYTMILWKDIPFALLNVFIGFTLADFYFRRRTNTLHVSKQTWSVLLLLTLAMVGIRYNGAVSMLLIPLLLVVLGIIRVRIKRKTLLWAAGFLLMAGVLWPTFSRTPKASFFVSETKLYVQQVRQRISPEYILQQGRKYFGILNVNQKERQWDLVHYCLYGRYNNDFLRRVGWNDVYSFLPLPRTTLQRQLAKIFMDLYWETYRAPWVYLTWNPVFMLAFLPILPLFLKKLPMTSVFSFFIVVQAAVLVFFDIFNWRYYYFLYLALYFLIPFIGADLARKKPRISKKYAL